MTDETDLHCQRMRALVEYTASSFDTEFPSPFGCAIYDEAGVLLAQAYDTVWLKGDPTCHGEVNAIRLAVKTNSRRTLEGATLYRTCEPCAMCMAASVWAKVETVVFGAFTNEDATHYWPQSMDLRARDIAQHMVLRAPMTVIEGVERQACKQLFFGWEVAAKRLGLAP